MAIEIVDLAIKIWMFHSYVSLPEGSSFGNENTPIFSDKPWKSNHKQGLVNVPFWEYWTSPEKVAMALTIYRFWLGDVQWRHD